MKSIQTNGLTISLAFLTSCVSSPPPRVQQADVRRQTQVPIQTADQSATAARLEAQRAKELATLPSEAKNQSPSHQAEVSRQPQVPIQSAGQSATAAGFQAQRTKELATLPSQVSRQSPSRFAAGYTIDVTVEFSSTITAGENRVMVELRQGVPGASSVFDTKYFEGRSATVSFSNMPAGSYFIAIGNGDSVAVGPVRQFSNGQRVHTRVHVTPSSGNISTRSRRSL